MRKFTNNLISSWIEVYFSKNKNMSNVHIKLFNFIILTMSWIVWHGASINSTLGALNINLTVLFLYQKSKYKCHLHFWHFESLFFSFCQHPKFRLILLTNLIIPFHRFAFFYNLLLSFSLLLTIWTNSLILFSKHQIYFRKNLQIFQKFSSVSNKSSFKQVRKFQTREIYPTMIWTSDNRNMHIIER